MRIAVVGCGAIGGTLAADLAGHAAPRHAAPQGLRVALYSRTQLPQLISEWPGGRAVLQQAACTDPAQPHPPADWLLLCTKAHQVDHAMPWLAALARGDGRTRLAVVQNGIEHVERVRDAAHLFAATVPVVAHLPAERLGPGHLRQLGSGRLVVPDSADGRDFARLFAAARNRVETTNDFRAAAWRKLLWNAPVGAICALSQRGTDILRDPTVRALARELMLEICRTAQAEGVNLRDSDADALLRRCDATTANSWPSIAVDRREGRAMEWVARNAVVSRFARKHGVATPRNDVLVTLLRAADRKALRARS